LSDASRELLGLQRSRSSFMAHTAEQKRWYHNTSRAFHRINDLMDPFPQERRESKTYTAIQEILLAHDSVLAEKRKARLDEFTKLLLVMTFKSQPRWLQRVSSKADISFDQTFVGTPTTKSFNRKTLPEKVAHEARVADKRTLPPGPVDAFAGFHVRSGERTDNRKGQTDKAGPTKKRGSEDVTWAWGWEANLAARVDSERPGSRRFPQIVLAATLSLPNINVAEEAVSLMKATKATGLTPGVADADKQYWANSTVDRLHDPAFNEGFTPSTEYRRDRLGVQGGNHGALYAEGDVYCPGTPTALLNASIHLNEGRIDTATYRLRLKERPSFALHQKEKADAKGRIVLTCPALGPSPTVVCPIREMILSKAANKVANKERPSVDDEDTPDVLDKICKQHSVSFNSAEFRRQKQAFSYGSEEWERFHTHARNSIESLNAQVKAGGAEDIENASRRRVRGFGAAQIVISILLANFNLRKIAAFISDKIAGDAKKDALGAPAIATKRKRDREHHNPYTGTYPEGVTRPSKSPPPPPSDETGGPPRRL
jgi:hypothetical protein